MRVSWTHQYNAISKLVHDIMFQPFLDLLLHQNKSEYTIRELSRQMKYNVWQNKNQLEMYIKYYQEYGLFNKFRERMELAKLVTLWEVQRWTRIDLEKKERMLHEYQIQRNTEKP